MSDIAADAHNVYVASPSLRQVFKVPVAGGPVTVVSCADIPVDLALDDQFVYVAGTGTMTVFRAPK
jgi:hypothetical protein